MLPESHNPGSYTMGETLLSVWLVDLAVKELIFLYCTQGLLFPFFGLFVMCACNVVFMII